MVRDELDENVVLETQELFDSLRNPGTHDLHVYLGHIYLILKVGRIFVRFQQGIFLVLEAHIFGYRYAAEAIHHDKWRSHVLTGSLGRSSFSEDAWGEHNQAADW